MNITNSNVRILHGQAAIAENFEISTSYFIKTDVQDLTPVIELSSLDTTLISFPTIRVSEDSVSNVRSYD